MIKEEEQSPSSSSVWTWEEDKEFENALADTIDDCDEKWEKIAAAVPGRTIEELKYHYELLVEDINNIDLGRVPLPSYGSDDKTDHVGKSGATKRGGSSGSKHGRPVGSSGAKHGRPKGSGGGPGSFGDKELRKGVAWSEDEHSFWGKLRASILEQTPATESVESKMLFLLGLEKFGKGDWRSIALNFVESRTATQVASHAQKYFIRLNSNKDRKRASIHDITSARPGAEALTHGHITGESNAPAARGVSGRPSKKHQQPSLHPGFNLYGGTALGQPFGVPTVGNPVRLYSPGQVASGVRVPVTAISGTPTNKVPTTCSMPHASAQM